MQSESPTAAGGAGRTLVVLNPAAGHDDPERLRARIVRAFDALDAPFEIAVTQYPGHATALAREAVRDGHRAVAAVGGDGTLAEVATGLAGSSVPLAIVPRGTANQVASNLGIPARLERAIHVAVHGVPTAMDLGTIGDRYFALVAGAGFDAAVMVAATRNLKERFGFGAYVIAAVKEALNARPARFSLVIDDREPIEVDAVSVLIANTGELFAGFLPFTVPLAPRPTGSWHDGFLDVVVLAPDGPTGFADVLWKALRRQFHGNDHLIHFQARSVTVDTDRPVPTQIDGDPTGTTPITAAVAPGALHVLRPRQ
ncbi:MAG TPA: diacylglycerol kinase family protein [Longimicrobiales bacterium]|nr:diacylglycerol kinase family protein [Longimicrobiales bacterium]